MIAQTFTPEGERPMIQPELLEKFSNPRGDILVGVSANDGIHTNALIAGACFAVEDAIDAGNEIANEINLLWRNDGRDADTAIRVAEQYCHERVTAVLGHLSASASISASNIYARNGIIFFASGTSHKALCTPDKNTVFRLCAEDDAQAQALITFARQKLRASSFYLVVQDIEYGHSLKSHICECLGEEELAHEVLIVSSPSELGALCVTLKSLENINLPAVVFVCAIHENAIGYINRMVDLGYTGPILAGDDCNLDQFWQNIHVTRGGIYVSKLASVNTSLSSNEDGLSKRFQDHFSTSPSAYFLTSYSAMQIIINSIQHNREDLSIPLESLIRSNQWPTAYGELSFDAVGNVNELRWDIYGSDWPR